MILFILDPSSTMALDHLTNVIKFAEYVQHCHKKMT